MLRCPQAGWSGSRPVTTVSIHLSCTAGVVCVHVPVLCWARSELQGVASFGQEEGLRWSIWPSPGRVMSRSTGSPPPWDYSLAGMFLHPCWFLSTHVSSSNMLRVELIPFPKQTPFPARKSFPLNSGASGPCQRHVTAASRWRNTSADFAFITAFIEAQISDCFWLFAEHIGVTGFPF